MLTSNLFGSASESSDDDSECIQVEEKEEECDGSDSESSDDGNECVQEVEEKEEECDVSYYNALKEKCLQVLDTTLMNTGGVKDRVVRKLDEIGESRTPDEVKATYKGEIDRLKKAISHVEHQMNIEVEKNKNFWKFATKHLPERGEKSRIRLRKSQGGQHRLFSCQMAYCAAQVKDPSRHLAHAHDITDSDARKEIIQKWKDQKQQKTLSSKALRRCCLCDKVLKSIDGHLVQVHGLSRGTPCFRDHLNRCARVHSEEVSGEPIKPKDLQLQITEDCAFKPFLEAFREHLKSSSNLGPTSVDFSVRQAADLIRYSFFGQKEQNFDGLGLIKTFHSLDDPKSFLRRRGDTLTDGYCCKIIITCIRVLDLLRDRRTTLRFQVDLDLAQETEDTLRNLLKRYQKKEKERAASQEQEASPILSTEEISRLLASPVVKAVLERAADSLEREELRPLTLSNFLSLRNALITSLFVRSLLRVQELIEFTVGEWEARTTSQEGEERLVKIKRHKPMFSISAYIVLNPVEERALQAYMFYARSFITECKRKSCPVFISSPILRKKEKCCVKMCFSNMTRILSKVATKAGLSSRTIKPRVIRQSTILAASKNNPDPATRQELLQLPGHNIETAQHYYDTSEQSHKVVKKLEQHRGTQKGGEETNRVEVEHEGSIPVRSFKGASPPAVQTKEGKKAMNRAQTISNGGTFLAPLPPIEEREDPAAAHTLSPTKSVLSTVTSVTTGASSLSVITSSEDNKDTLSIPEFYKIVVAEQKALGARTGEKVFRWKALRRNLSEKHPYFHTHTWEQVRSRYKQIRTLISKMK